MRESSCPGLSRRRFVKNTGLAAASLATLPLLKSEAAPSASPDSMVFQVDDVRGVEAGGHFGGLDDLLLLMGNHGLKFYQSTVVGPQSGPGGLIGPDDVVMLKLNSQWDDRGMTNVDLVRGLVQRIVEHPDGFTGEIVLVENIQFVDASDTFGWQTLTNCEDRSQTYRDIISDYAALGHHISGYAWKDIRFNVVTTADDHITDNYYHDPTRASEHYPRFTTSYGTRINFKLGLWTGSTYDDSRVKLINLPVLKDHQYKVMITACMKNYMGVISPSSGDAWGISYHNNFQTLSGRMMGTTRFPDLSILDATHVITANGPEGDAGNAVWAGILLAGQDPVAIDYHAGKHVLYPLSGNSRHHPDGSNNLHTCLLASSTDLRALGYAVIPTLDDSAYALITPSTPVETVSGVRGQTWSQYR